MLVFPANLYKWTERVVVLKLALLQIVFTDCNIQALLTLFIAKHTTRRDVINITFKHLKPAEKLAGISTEGVHSVVG